MEDGDDQQRLDAEADARAVSQILDQTNAIYDTMLLRTALHLNLFDIIHSHGGAATVSHLAAALSPHQPINTDPLSRVLRYLAHMRLLSKPQHDDDTYALTAVSRRFLLKEPTTSLRSTVLMCTDECFTSTWYGLGDALLGESGRNMFGVKHGAGLFEEMERRPELGVMFNESMAAETRLLMPGAVRAMEGCMRGVRSMVDVGGGTGAAAFMVARAFPGVKCSVLDLAHVVHAAEDGVVAEVEMVAGDMFDQVPHADVVMLKRVLHDWDDEKCVRILELSKKAIPSEGGKVIIIEIVMDEDDDIFNTQKLRLDLGMMFIGGRERTRDEWSSLLHDAGLNLHKIIPVTLGQSIIEAHPR